MGTQRRGVLADALNAFVVEPLGRRGCVLERVEVGQRGGEVTELGARKCGEFRITTRRSRPRNRTRDIRRRFLSACPAGREELRESGSAVGETWGLRPVDRCESRPRTLRHPAAHFVRREKAASNRRQNLAQIDVLNSDVNAGQRLGWQVQHGHSRNCIGRVARGVAAVAGVIVDHLLRKDRLRGDDSLRKSVARAVVLPGLGNDIERADVNSRIEPDGPEFARRNPDDSQEQCAVHEFKEQGYHLLIFYLSRKLAPIIQANVSRRLASGPGSSPWRRCATSASRTRRSTARRQGCGRRRHGVRDHRQRVHFWRPQLSSLCVEQSGPGLPAGAPRPARRLSRG
jgi:hypothetical protein